MSDDDTRAVLLDAVATGTLLSFWASRRPDAAAIVSEHGDRTFAQLDAEANQLARAWRDRGLVAGDAVAAMISNRAEFATVLAAAQRTGLRFTPINWHLTADEAAYIVDNCEAKAFVADSRFASVARDAARRATGATTLFSVGGDIDGFEHFDSVLAPESGAALVDPVLGSTMLYTSGTTGRPKGVHRDAEAVRAAASQPPDRQVALPPSGQVAEMSMHLCTGPLYHAAPLAFSMASPAAAGVGIVLMDGWSAEETLRLIAKHRVTHSHMVPTMFHRLLSLPDDVREAADTSSLIHIWHGAAPCPVAVKQRIIDWWGPVLFEYYAATEGVGTSVDSIEWQTRPGTVGHVPVPDHIKIMDDDGAELPPGETGRIFLRAPKGGEFDYFKDPEKTAGSYQGEYFTLGDVGYLDEDDYLFLTDRSVDLIISGGVNVYPAEVEGELLAHPSVGDAAVIGVPDEDWGESVLAVVELRSGVHATPDLAAELVEHCRSRLAHFKCPRRIEFVDLLPRADNGKLYKRRIRDEYRAAVE